MIVGNLKMNMNTNNISSYLKEMSNITNKEVIICPTSIYVPYFLKQKFSVGLQDVFYEDLGTFTGEICPRQAVTLGIKYTLIGHSERRLLNETDEIINKKINNAIKFNMTPILCIGETEKEKKAHKTKKVLLHQIKEDLKNTFVDKVIIAYEPVWSIGTNELPTNKEIEENVCYIKDIVKKLYNFDIKVLYGGSIHKENINKIKEIENIDGILVGDAAQRPEEFKKIISSFDKTS